MKPWEMNLQSQDVTSQKPWEQDWNTEPSEINASDFNGSYLTSDNGDSSSLKKLDAIWDSFVKNITTFEVKKLTPEEMADKDKNIAERLDKLGVEPEPLIGGVKAIASGEAFSGGLDVGEVSKSLARASFQSSYGLGGLVKIMGDWWRDERSPDELLPSEIESYKWNHAISDSIIGIGQAAQDISEYVMNRNFLKPDAEYFEGSFEENPSLTRTASAVISSLPSLLSIRGYAKVLGTPTALGIVSGLETQDLYWESQEAGKSKDVSKGLFVLGTTGTVALEKLGFDAVFNTKVTPFAVKVVNSMLKEGLTEGVQTVYQNLLKRIGYDNTQKLFEGVVESFIGGFGSGGVATTYISKSEKRTDAENAMREQGMTNEDIAVIEDAIGREMIAHKDTIEPMFQSNLAKSAETLNAVKEKFAELPEEQRMQVSRELETLYGEVRRQLTGIVDDVEADSLAKMHQGNALYVWEATGIMPSEYSKRMAKFVRTKADEVISDVDEEIPFQFQEEVYVDGKADINTPKFKKWFSDSKVVDENGNPLVVYHGTNAEFDTFDIRKFGQTDSGYLGRGFYFSDNYDTAETYADDADNGLVMSTYIRIANPYNLEYRGAFGEPSDILTSQLGVRNATEATQKLKEQGYDGVILTYGDGERQYVAFEPNQIKSVYNRGTWGKEVDNIYYQSAFAGSRVDYERPSLDAMGTGEGNAAHGWGLYYALDKDVAESYRKKFLTGDSLYNNFSYNGSKELSYNEEETLASIVSTVISDNKDIKEVVKDKIDDYKETIRINSEQIDKEESEDAKELRQEIIDDAKASLSFLQNFNPDDVSINKGQVHEVDLPENPFLLDEQKTYEEQPDVVKKALDSIFNSVSDGYKNKDKVLKVYKNRDGSFLYKMVAEVAYFEKNGTLNGVMAKDSGADKLASELLNKHGVKGITYWGQRDGRCFVIFNPNDVKVIQKFYQDEASPRGAYKNNIIYLFEEANRSTASHELVHSWSKQLRQLAEEFDSDKIRNDLETFERWSTSEFNRKYQVVKRVNGYAVVDKKGAVIYDKRGKGFSTELEAQEYAKEELFAQGFEEYLRQGKAPSNALKQVFRNFLMWLKKIYKDAMALNIELSPDMKNLYADLLGGADLDYFLNSDVDSFIENRVKMGEEQTRDLDDIITVAQANKDSKRKDKKGKGLAETWSKAMIPLSTRAKRVSKALQTRLRKYEFNLANGINKKYAEAEPFMNIWKTMSEDDAIAFDLALKNDYVDKQLEIVDKYNARKEWEKVRGLLINIYDEAINYGIDLNYRPDYFPRKVVDADGYLSFLRGLPEWTRFQSALDEADPENIFTVQEKAEFINKYLRGFVKVDIMPSKTSFEKQRRIEVIDAEMNKFYADSSEALVLYIEGMNKRIESAKFLGRDSEKYDESIGSFLTFLLENNMIDDSQVDEVRDILSARLNERGVTNAGLNTLRDLSYMYTMGGINSAITQIDDLSLSMFKAGVWNTISTALSSKRITKKDLGLDVIGEEFKSTTATSKALNKIFKLTGLDAIDSFGKETLINSMLKKYRSYSDETLRSVIEPIMEESTAQTISDIRNDVVSDDVLFLLYNDLSDVQPISKSELPAYYNTSGNMRLAYMLKSFMIKRIDVFRNEAIDKIKDPKTRKEGMQNLVRLAVFMMLLGATKDMIINLLYGRDIDVSEIMVNNALGLAGISKFQVYQARDKGFSSVAKDFVFPPIFAIYDDLMNDVSQISKGKRKIRNMEVLKGIPLVGRFYYWHVGRGKEKLEKRKKKSY